MDAIWAPTRFIADFVQQCGFPHDIPLIPWAHHFAKADSSHDSTDDIAFHLLPRLGSQDSLDADCWQESSLLQQQRCGSDVFVAIQSLAPRKGLPILIKEWHRHVNETPHSTSLLLLKLSFRHAHGIGPEREATSRQSVAPVWGAKWCSNSARPHQPSLSESEMRRLTGGASAVVTCSYGEGFGGPVMEAINLGTPVIASCHTRLADLLPANYPLQYASRRVRVQLRDLADVYPPSASWFVPESGALAGALTAFSEMTPAQRAKAVVDARHHAEEFCGVPVVRRLLSDAVKTIVRRRELA